MNPDNLDISGDWDTDPAVLEKFSRDMSAYRILPALVVAPKNEEDVLRTLRFAHNEGLGIVSRSGGSDLSGAAAATGSGNGEAGTCSRQELAPRKWQHVVWFIAIGRHIPVPGTDIDIRLLLVDIESKAAG